MPLTVNIDLSDDDLQHFARAAETARQRATDLSNEQVVNAATQLLAKAQETNPPQFVRDRLLVLETLIDMMRDSAWSLAEEDASNVRAALVYFAAASDAIPDSVPVLGFIDDAIMIELCARELRHEIEAYDDFCEYREREADRRNVEPHSLGRVDWLDSRRVELQDRMRRRRARDFGGGFGSGFGHGYGSSSGYAASRSFTSPNRLATPFRTR